MSARRNPFSPCPPAPCCALLCDSRHEAPPTPSPSPASAMQNCRLVGDARPTLLSVTAAAARHAFIRRDACIHPPCLLHPSAACALTHARTHARTHAISVTAAVSRHAAPPAAPTPIDVTWPDVTRRPAAAEDALPSGSQRAELLLSCSPTRPQAACISSFSSSWRHLGTGTPTPGLTRGQSTAFAFAFAFPFSEPTREQASERASEQAGKGGGGAASEQARAYLGRLAGKRHMSSANPV